MQKRKSFKYGKYEVFYNILSTKFCENRVYHLISLTLPKMSKPKRKKILEVFLERTGAIGSFEWWTHGSILRKPVTTFELILIFEK